MNSMNTATTYFSTKSFESLTPSELYAIIQLRNEVFVVEQNWPQNSREQTSA